MFYFTIDNRMFYFTSAAIIRQLLDTSNMDDENRITLLLIFFIVVQVGRVGKRIWEKGWKEMKVDKGKKKKRIRDEHMEEISH
jgi:hypothetical protein